MTIEEKLKSLGYIKEWIEYGILSEELLENQLSDQISTGHECTEHYRYGAFHKWLHERQEASKTEINAYVFLAKNDPDPAMGGSALIDLLKAPWLSDRDFEYVANEINLDEEWFEKEVSKISIRRMVEKEDISDEIFEKVLNSDDSIAQRKLLSHPNISALRVRRLAEQGASKKVRNIATQMVKGKWKDNT